MAIIGGTFAKLGGGKFANGALSAAFVHLFNGEVKFDPIELLEKGYEYYKTMDKLNKKVEFVKALTNLGKALKVKDLKLAATSYAKLYKLVAVPFEVVPVKPEAIENAIELLKNGNNGKNIQTKWWEKFCNGDKECLSKNAWQ